MLESTEDFIISSTEVLSNKILKLGFSKKYKIYFNEFHQNLNEGSKLDVKEILHNLISLYLKHSLNSEWKTIFLDFAWAVLDLNPNLWNDDEKENGFSEIGNHLKEFYPDYESKEDYIDIGTLDYMEYFVIGMEIFNSKKLNQKDKEILCFAMFQFFQRWKFQFTKERMKLERQIMKEAE